MTSAVSLETGPARGRWRTAALVCRRREGRAVAGGGAFWVEARPIAVLVSGPSGIAAFAPSGQPLDLALLRRRHREAMARFETEEDAAGRGDAPA